MTQKTFPDALETDLQDFAQMYGGIDYTDIMNLRKKWPDLNSETREAISYQMTLVRNLAAETELDLYELSLESEEDKETLDKLTELVRSAIR